MNLSFLKIIINVFNKLCVHIVNLSSSISQGFYPLKVKYIKKIKDSFYIINA